MVKSLSHFCSQWRTICFAARWRWRTTRHYRCASCCRCFLMRRPTAHSRSSFLSSSSMFLNSCSCKFAYACNPINVVCWEHIWDYKITHTYWKMKQFFQKLGRCWPFFFFFFFCIYTPMVVPHMHSSAVKMTRLWDDCWYFESARAILLDFKERTFR